MSWRRAIGILAVLGVIGLTLGTIVGLATLLAQGIQSDVVASLQLPLVVTVVVIAGGLAGIVVLGRPSREWFGNPYW